VEPCEELNFFARAIWKKVLFVTAATCILHEEKSIRFYFGLKAQVASVTRLCAIHTLILGANVLFL